MIWWLVITHRSLADTWKTLHGIVLQCVLQHVLQFVFRCVLQCMLQCVFQCVLQSKT